MTEEVICPHCNGSGEGRRPSMSCIVCRGRGVIVGEEHTHDFSYSYLRFDNLGLLEEVACCDCGEEVA